MKESDCRRQDEASLYVDQEMDHDEMAEVLGTDRLCDLVRTYVPVKHWHDSLVQHRVEVLEEEDAGRKLAELESSDDFYL